MNCNNDIFQSKKLQNKKQNRQNKQKGNKNEINLVNEERCTATIGLNKYKLQQGFVNSNDFSNSSPLCIQ